MQHVFGGSASCFEEYQRRKSCKVCSRPAIYLPERLSFLLGPPPNTARQAGLR
jgi:hypothetical protein